jgi:hypothetical protein
MPAARLESSLKQLLPDFARFIRGTWRPGGARPTIPASDGTLPPFRKPLRAGHSVIRPSRLVSKWHFLAIRFGRAARSEPRAAVGQFLIQSGPGSGRVGLRSRKFRCPKIAEQPHAEKHPSTLTPFLMLVRQYDWLHHVFDDVAANFVPHSSADTGREPVVEPRADPSFRYLVLK